MQAKLLRVLQSGEFERVGSSKTLKTDARLICATNKNLKEEVAGGRFREDLFYRINVILLEIPALRTRRNDIPTLATHYLKFFAQQNRKKIKRIRPDAMKLLEKYDWPGNVRELKNVIERMVVLSNLEEVPIDLVPEDFKTGPPPALNNNSSKPSSNTIRGMEGDMIRQALKEVNNNKSLAAKKLGISRRTLYRKIEEYQIKD